MEVTLNSSSNGTGHSNCKTNFSYKLLLTGRKVPSFCKIIIKALKTQLSKLVQLERFFEKFTITIHKR